MASSDPVDFSKYDFPRKLWFIKPTNEIVYKSLILVPIVLFGLIGNSILLNIILKNRALHTPTNILLANMISADILTLLFCPSMYICSDYFQNFLLGPIGCKIDGSLQVTVLITSVLNLCAVSYDRLTAIVLPRESRFTVRVARIIMCLTWLAGLAIGIPFTIYRNYKERLWKNYNEKYCVENLAILPIYWHIILLLLVWVPLTVMIVCYSTIFLKLDRYEQRVLKRENSITVSYKKKVARMLFIIVIIFIILHLPFTALIYMRTKLLQNLVMNQLEGGFYLLSCVSQFSLFLNATANPIIYGLTNDNFRRAYHQTPILPNLFTRWIQEIKQFYQKKNNFEKKPRQPIQPIIHRLTLETALSPTTTEIGANISQKKSIENKENLNLTFKFSNRSGE